MRAGQVEGLCVRLEAADRQSERDGTVVERRSVMPNRFHSNLLLQRGQIDRFAQIATAVNHYGVDRRVGAAQSANRLERADGRNNNLAHVRRSKLDRTRHDRPATGRQHGQSLGLAQEQAEHGLGLARRAVLLLGGSQQGAGRRLNAKRTNAALLNVRQQVGQIFLTA